MHFAHQNLRDARFPRRWSEQTHDAALPLSPQAIRRCWPAGFRRARAAAIFGRKVNEALRIGGLTHPINAFYSNDLIDFCARERI